MIPDQIPASERYKLLNPLGEGGQGKVCKAFDLQLQRFVAVKLISKGREDHSDDVLFQEALTLANLRHPNIVPVFDVVRGEEGLLVVMELLEGEDLSEWLQGEKLSMDDVHQLGSQLLEALLAAHEMKLLHRDLKPENVRVSRLPGGRLQVRVLDFGLARYSANNRRQEAKNGTVTGTIFYMSPEQLEHEPMDARSDLYALACVLYQVLSGRMPFNGETVKEVIAAHLEHQVTPLIECNPDLPVSLCDWVMWTMNRHPKDRPANARVALEYFNNIFDHIKADRQIDRAIQIGRVIGNISSQVPVEVSTPAPVPASVAAASAAVSLPGRTTGVMPSQPASSTAGTVSPPADGKRKLPLVPIAVGAVLVVVGLIVALSMGGKSKDSELGAGGKSPAQEVPPSSSPTPASKSASKSAPTAGPVASVRPSPPLEDRLLARFVASDKVLGFKDDPSKDVPAEVGMGVSVWNDLVTSGGNTSLKARDRVLEHCPVWSLVPGEGASGQVPVVAFNKGQYLQASFPPDAADQANLDPSVGGGSRAGHTIVLVLRPREVKHENRLITLRQMSTTMNKRSSYQLMSRFDGTLRFQASNSGSAFAGCTIANPFTVDQFTVITCVASQTEGKLKLRTRVDGGGAAKEASETLSFPLPALDDLFIGSAVTGGGGGFSPDCFADFAEILIYRSALDDSLVQDLESQLANHYFKK